MELLQKQVYVSYGTLGVGDVGSGRSIKVKNYLSVIFFTDFLLLLLFVDIFYFENNYFF